VSQLSDIAYFASTSAAYAIRKTGGTGTDIPEKALVAPDGTFIAAVTASEDMAYVMTAPDLEWEYDQPCDVSSFRSYYVTQAASTEEEDEEGQNASRMAFPVMP